MVPFLFLRGSLLAARLFWAACICSARCVCARRVLFFYCPAAVLFSDPPDEGVEIEFLLTLYYRPEGRQGRWVWCGTLGWCGVSCMFAYSNFCMSVHGNLWLIQPIRICACLSMETCA